MSLQHTRSHNLTFSTLLLLPLLFLGNLLPSHLADAAVTPETLPGLYRLHAGSSQCADLLRLTQSTSQLPASAIEQNNVPCSGGDLFLLPNNTGGNGLANFLRQNSALVGVFQTGLLTAPLSCGDNVPSIAQNSVFVFFQPERRFFVVWQEVYGSTTPLEDVTSMPSFNFEPALTYVVIDDRCLYQRDSGGTGTTSGGGYECFPASAVVQTLRRGSLPISRVTGGDIVRTGMHTWSPVIGWSHRNARKVSDTFVHITTAAADDANVTNILTVTHGHIVHLCDAPARPAHTLQHGDCLPIARGDSLQMTASSPVRLRCECVVRLRFDVRAVGLFNPHTVHGTIVVDGFVVSTYTTAVPVQTAHAMLVPLRWLAFGFAPVVRGAVAESISVVVNRVVSLL